MKKILIIDDDELTLHFLRAVLLREGYEVTIATNGENGLALFRQNPADLVVTDMVMPVKDGLKTIMELREIDEDVPVIAISGGGAIAKERYLAVAGFLENVRALAKPLQKDDLRRVVREMLFPG